MSYGLTLMTAPTVEPVSLDEAKAHLRVEIADDDQLIQGLITAARELAETTTGRQFCTATWKLTLDRFPCWEIYLPRPRLQSVSSITYLDTAGATQTLSASLYTVDITQEPGRVTPAYGQTWPTTRDQIGAVNITYVAGYGGASAVPAGIKAAMKLLLAHWYEHREEVILGTIQTEMDVASRALLRPFWTGEYPYG